MTREIGAGVIAVAFHPTLTSFPAPTAAHLNAADVSLTPFLVDIATPLDGSIVDGSDMSAKFNKTGDGTYGGQPLTMTLYRDKPTDLAWTTLPRGTSGFISIARFGLALPGTFAIADVIDVWPIKVISRNPADAVRNEYQRFVVSCAVPEVPIESFPIAA